MPLGMLDSKAGPPRAKHAGRGDSESAKQLRGSRGQRHIISALPAAPKNPSRFSVRGAFASANTGALEMARRTASRGKWVQSDGVAFGTCCAGSPVPHRYWEGTAPLPTQPTIRLLYRTKTLKKEPRPSDPGCAVLAAAQRHT